MYAGLVALQEVFRVQQLGDGFRVAVVVVRVHRGRVGVPLVRRREGGVVVVAVAAGRRRTARGCLSVGGFPIEAPLVVIGTIAARGCQHETLAYFNHHRVHNCRGKKN